MKRLSLCLLWLVLAVTLASAERQKLNFNADWRLTVGDVKDAASPAYDDAGWQRVTLPFAFNGNEAFKVDIAQLTDTICWYRKHFHLTQEQVGGKVFVEFEGARQGADVYVNGRHVGFSDNGVMAFGFDLTPFVRAGQNLIAVRCDNSWTYRDRILDSRYQWNDKNFNANYGGLTKNVFLHITDKLYQTLPLYSNLKTTGTYIYATDFNVAERRAVIHAESEVSNDDSCQRSFTFVAKVFDLDGREVASMKGDRVTVHPGERRRVTIAQEVGNLHFWSWGYGYLYTVKTQLVADDGSVLDCVATRTGFRKTKFAEGKVWLNDRVMMMHGYAQRTSNEWPGVGIGVPAWLSDYSNALMVESGANLVRWMHVTPWKQDVESCDRVGLLQAMPAGDAEKDVEGPRWQQRVQLMRDAIIYNRNNPSVVFYEGGNESVSREHMLELKALRNEYDPHGGRAIGSREMLDIDEAEYGGEMLYINKSAKHPMWAMEYNRDEGLRKYWDAYSYPYHQEGDGPLYRGAPALEYNHNMDAFARGMVERWHEYWLERPGTGRRVSSGGVKIVFSDTNTHHRGESNYRTSGVVDAMRIPKDAFFVHQVMWDGWVSPEHPRTYIIGHWNYPEQTRKDVYVVSTADEVELFVNGKSIGKGQRSYQWLFTFKDVAFEPGVLEARGSDGSSFQIETAGEPYQLKLTAIENPEGMKADGADMALIQVEVVDRQGRRCPLDNRMMHFHLWGEAKWIGGIASQRPEDNYVGRMSLPVECGVNRVLVRSTSNAGHFDLSVWADGVRPAYLTMKTHQSDCQEMPQSSLRPLLSRGETPATASYREVKTSAVIVGAKTGSNMQSAVNSYDDNELSEWRSDGEQRNAWITYQLDKKRTIDEIAIKLSGWRQKCYPLEVYAGKKKVWEGLTDATLGYAHICIDAPEASRELTIRMVAPAQNTAKFGSVKELAGGHANEFDRVKTENVKVELRIVEVDLLERK
ncbi:DUF4982 domain-containing protein [Prevotella sp. E13-17]|uniref:glycoside hydrolase family 2 protein n=1 Tax=Prevotella sp. E13-17 TaxID=2913616 RepID=UPI001EDAEB3B|nr:sugar-binding domain-containing protein [Prevotella sp. E13-17]UKK51646.1 DUF4982 domain-containing protein [Prevotella sp. E13-17]